MTSGTPPARNTCTVGWLRGPFGKASTIRGILEQIGRSAESGVHNHCIFDCAQRDNVPCEQIQLDHPQGGSG
jgi:hypothetical protein